MKEVSLGGPGEEIQSLASTILTDLGCLSRQKRHLDRSSPPSMARAQDTFECLEALASIPSLGCLIASTENITKNTN